jgi:Sulfotransferase domain
VAAGVDFVGVGAQRSGTSWLYACLYEHPGICAPIKELHFFSRERNYERGLDWYLGHFDRCPPGAVRGEFSTSYLYAPEAAGRIRAAFPEVRIMMSLRNPVARAYSQYRNAIVAGEIGKERRSPTMQAPTRA